MLKANTWEDVYSQQDAQSAFTNFIDFIVRSFNESCPMETIKIKNIIIGMNGYLEN